MKELEYPFNSQFILQNTRKIRKALLQQSQATQTMQTTWRNIKIAILGGSTTASIRTVIELFLLNVVVNKAILAKSNRVNKHTFKITASYPADALEDKKKLALLPFPVTIEFRPDIYPNGDILFFGDWFRVKDQAEAFEVAEEVEKFVRELIEALNLMPMKSD